MSLAPRIDLLENNWILNGVPRISQRGDFTNWTNIVGNKYHLDRWKDSIQGFTPQFKQQVSSLGTESIIIQNNTGIQQTGRIRKYQLIEDFSLLGGYRVNLSAMVRSNNPNARLSLLADNAFVDENVHSGSGNFEELYVSYQLPVLSANLGAYFQISDSGGGSVNINANDYLEYSQVRLTISNNQNFMAHVPRMSAQEFIMCQRYFEKSYAKIYAPGHAVDYYYIQHYAESITHTSTISYINFKVTKASNPSVTFYSYNTGAANKVFHNVTGGDISVLAYSAGDSGAAIQNLSGGTVSGRFLFHYTAEAEM